MLPELAGMLTQVLKAAPLSSRDVYGEETYGTQVELSARISEKPRVVRTRDGTEVVSNVTAWVDPGSTTISETDQFELPDGTKPLLLALERFVDDLGRVHLRLGFGRQRQVG